MKIKEKLKNNIGRYNPLILIDFYKACHAEQYPKNLAKVVAYYTLRMSRLLGVNKVVFAGLQALNKQYLQDAFQTLFFDRDKNEVISEYKELLDKTLGETSYGLKKIEDLHDLGYLPIEIKALPEGSLVDIKVPVFEISNTHPNFAWVTNTIETLISCTMWHTMQSAQVGYTYRKIVEKYYKKTVVGHPISKALGDFSLRGQESIESGIKSSAGWLMSFHNTATVPAIKWLHECYGDPLEEIGSGAISTEHSVMCSNFAIDGDEITNIKRLLTEIYPNNSFSMVSDSYDYWNLVKNILPECKKEILDHKGYIGIRGDSGDPVKVVTQTVFELWKIFGGTTNSKGYKVLDPHVKAIYGDSITPQRCEKIYTILEKKGFACNNVILGVGSFSMQCLEQEVPTNKFQRFFYKLVNKEIPKTMNPYTRDTFGVAIKATYCETEDGKEIPIFKNPKEGGFKVSQKGCCIVGSSINDKTGEKDFYYIDGKNFKDTQNKNNELKTVFKDGKIIKEVSLATIRKTLHGTF